ncbi:MAG: hypothetical protein A2958_01430 [Candidatus Levybacteria bacterium RIFCSPLOWO2_01_FULL_38_13]|nr:MAG: hypothetical protein A2629_01640 [Candidatus Levybacteria bacterium RIFCSPHIGHO2_01_FULL_41_15]OGH34610.1 MAG: hypothetical protein A2958_01430 [Candidatus Levybacteria bacterium RIFCSPLOWO2_01_FULL_38_13]
MTEGTNRKETVSRVEKEPIKTSWVVITGAPSSGKTTTFDYLSSILKKQGFISPPEIERRIIEEDQRRGVGRENTPEYAMMLEHRFLAAREELERSLDPSSNLVMDRSLLEIIAYARYYKASEGFAVGPAKRFRYKQIFYLEPINSYEQDTTRVEDIKFAKWMHKNLPKLYEEFGYEVIRVPAMPVDEREVPDEKERVAKSVARRADFILNKLGLEKEKASS